MAAAKQKEHIDQDKQAKARKLKPSWLRRVWVLLGVTLVLLFTLWIIASGAYLPERVKLLNSIPKTSSPNIITDELLKIYEADENASSLISKLMEDGFYVKSYSVTPYIWDKNIFVRVVFQRRPIFYDFCSNHIISLELTKDGTWSAKAVTTYTSCYL